MWETIPTPVTSNLILYDISFPFGRDLIGTILKTTDQGSTWRVIYSSTMNGTGVTALFFFDVDNGFEGTQEGNLMKTTDVGNTRTSTDFDTRTNQGQVNTIEFYDINTGIILTARGWCLLHKRRRR